MEAEICARRAFENRKPAQLTLQRGWLNNRVVGEKAAMYLQYIITVFAAFARECCALGKERTGWDAATVSRESQESLRLTTLYALDKYSYLDFPRPWLTEDGQITAEARALFEKTAEWKQYEEELLEVARPHSQPEQTGDTRSNHSEALTHTALELVAEATGRAADALYKNGATKPKADESVCTAAEADQKTSSIEEAASTNDATPKPEPSRTKRTKRERAAPLGH